MLFLYLLHLMAQQELRPPNSRLLSFKIGIPIAHHELDTGRLA